MKTIRYITILFLGFYFGFILTKGEVISFFRIQEMFYFGSFHMFGFIGTAVATAAISLIIIKKFKIRNADGEPIVPIPLQYNHGNVLGGILFGMGWAMVGACPGPMFALAGQGFFSIFIAIAGAVIGTYLYGIVADKMPR